MTPQKPFSFRNALKGLGFGGRKTEEHATEDTATQEPVAGAFSADAPENDQPLAPESEESSGQEVQAECVEEVSGRGPSAQEPVDVYEPAVVEDAEPMDAAALIREIDAKAVASGISEEPTPLFHEAVAQAQVGELQIESEAEHAAVEDHVEPVGETKKPLAVKQYSNEELHSPEFNDAFYYDGSLGVRFRETHTIFRLWAPTAQSVTLHLHTGEMSGDYQLELGSQGVWETSIPAKIEGSEYTYELSFPDGTVNRTVDPYARAATANGERGVVVDTQELLGSPHRMPAFSNPCDAVIYEAHVRDLTIGRKNGIKNKGKFVGLLEEGTRTTERNNPSGLDYISSLGITHLQLLPIYDFGSVDETGNLEFGAQYNWGYDPVNYNVPEGSYSVDPSDPMLRLKELRQLVDKLHQRGIRVIMDVVYNHVYDVDTNPLQLTVPNYFFRMTEDGQFHNSTGCGNETASEQLMMRKFIIDSVVYWAKTFGLDGFRFDLMGIHDVDTMNAVRAALDEIDPSIMIIGEGWEMGAHPKGVEGANMNNAKNMQRIAVFNDSFRDVVKGSNFSIGDPGFVSGNAWFKVNDDDPWAWPTGAARALYRNMVGGQIVRDFTAADQSVVYNEAHDNWTMFDKLSGTRTIEWSHEQEIIYRHVLATSIQILSNGIVFIHAGQEFMRTKYGEENSYASPDHINFFDYDRAERYAGPVELFKNLLAFRKKWAFLRENDYRTINQRTSMIFASGLRLSYRVANAFGPGRDAMIIINGADSHWHHPVSPGYYRVHINDGYVVGEPLPFRLDSEFVVSPINLTVLEEIVGEEEIATIEAEKAEWEKAQEALNHSDEVAS